MDKSFMANPIITKYYHRQNEYYTTIECYSTRKKKVVRKLEIDNISGR